MNNWFQILHPMLNGSFVRIQEQMCNMQGAHMHVEDMKVVSGMPEMISIIT
jgi:hypothetical protein